ncbi:hypothetical protein Dsin_011059 [Dipteronia sinensis]|uniref:Bromo domain-containing protein n=1 Tax=Dipteronia sinensis TaxID=43782 RepID=A0AAE0EDF6_9ROSI|nr:hypothetical protein Dsin_011059 [Dipteronia sinensis]
MTSKEDESSDKTTSSWGTWEELLLACAVKRHGLRNWDSVAMELRTKTSLPHLLTSAQFCKQKYMDLKRRFKDQHQSDNHNNIPWLEHLRKVRVDELKQDLQRYDLSINCLQLKVKRLEEERDRSLDNNNTSNEPEPDLNQPNTSLNDDDKRPQKSEEPDKTCARLVSGDESDRENRSVNESNSTGLSDKVGGEGGGELVKSEADPCRSGLGGDGAGQGQGQTTKESEESEELGDSVTQLSSDVQSSASFGRKKRKIGSGGDAKSEPLIELLDVIRTHKHASLFERRFKLQESSKYKEIVRQHVDLETIQTRVEQGTYSSCSLTNFYRDLLLVFNNAIVFFPKSSLEYTAAHQLRRLVSIKINKETPTQRHKPVSSQQPPVSLPPQPKTAKPHLERSDSLLDKQKSSAPIIVCRKRSSVSAKPSSTFAQKGDQQQQSDDKKPATTNRKPSVEPSSSLLKLKTPENSIITGTRSSRRNSSNNKNPTNTTPPPPSSSNKKQSTGTASGSKAGSASASVDKQETSKTDNNNNKKTEASSASDKKKSVVDFLKRIKKNSPVQTAKKNSNKGVSEEPKRNNNTNNNSSGKKEKKGKERQTSAERRQRKDTSPPKKNVGRPPKKAAETTPVTGKRAREVVVTKRQSKRSRR